MEKPYLIPADYARDNPFAETHLYKIYHDGYYYMIYLEAALVHVEMDVTLLGIVIFLRDLQSMNASYSILVTPSGITMLVNETHSANADSAMQIMLSGSVISVRDEQLPNV